MNTATLPRRVRLETRVALDLGRCRTERWLRRLRGEGDPRAAVANSLPKSGSHLLIRAMAALPGICRVRLRISPSLLHLLGDDSGPGAVPVGVASPVTVDPTAVRALLSRLPPGAFVTAHLPYSREAADLLGDVGVRTVLMVRDPRDVALSTAAYLLERPDHRLARGFVGGDLSTALLASIQGVEGAEGSPGLDDIGTRVRRVVGWYDDAGAAVVRFEDLVGPAGGGSSASQIEALRTIADHLETPATSRELSEIAATLFGGTPTFRRGQIGRWRDAFEASHVAAAKPLLDDLLVRCGYEEDDRWP